MKTLNPAIERLDERVAPDLLGGCLGGGLIITIDAQLGIGGGTSCNNYSGSSCENSSRDTHSGSCHCDRHSC